MSQQVLGPLVNGFLATTVSYLLVDWLFRSMVTPTVFPQGRVAAVSGSLAPGVRARLLLFLIAVAFIPLFMLLGLVRAAAVRLEAGMPAAEVVGVAREREHHHASRSSSSSASCSRWWWRARSRCRSAAWWRR